MTKYTIIYGVYTRFWPTLQMLGKHVLCLRGASFTRQSTLPALYVTHVVFSVCRCCWDCHVQQQPKSGCAANLGIDIGVH
jgi:hypothetical protein